LLKGATAEADKVMLTDAPLLFPPGQLALASLRIANGVLGVIDFDRYLENIVSQPNSEHTTSELTKLLDNIEYLVFTNFHNYLNNETCISKRKFY
jgi:cyclin H